MNHQWLYPIPGRPRNSGRNPRWGIPTCKALPFTGIIPFLCIQCTPFLVTIVTCWSDFICFRKFEWIRIKESRSPVWLSASLRRSPTPFFDLSTNGEYDILVTFFFIGLFSLFLEAFLRLCANVTWGSALRHSFILKVYIILQKK